MAAQRLWPWYLAAWAAGLGPALYLGWCILHGQMTANPVEFLEHQTGLRALQLLLATLAMTPLRRLTGAAAPLRIRRTLGLWAYAWLCVHLSMYLVFDLGFSAAQLSDDLIKRTYITLGFAGWLLLLPLAITSTHGWQRRLKRNWKRLHRLIYPAVLLGALHFVWLVKRDEREPLTYLAVLLTLLALRLPKPSRWRAILPARSPTQNLSLEPESNPAPGRGRPPLGP